MKKLLLLTFVLATLGLTNNLCIADENASFSMTSEQLVLPVVDVQEYGFFKAEMYLWQDAPFILELIPNQVESVQNVLSPIAEMSFATGALHIPLLEVTDLTANVEHYEAFLSLVPETNPSRFQLTQAIPYNNNAVFEILATKQHSLTDVPTKAAEIDKIFAVIATAIEATDNMTIAIGENRGRTPCGGDVPNTLLSLPAVDFNMDGSPDDIGRMMEISFSKDSVFLANGLNHGIMLPWQIAIFTQQDTLYVTAGVPETLVRLVFRDAINYDRLVSLARDYHRQIRTVVASALEGMEGFHTNVNQTWMKRDNTPFSLGEQEIAELESRLKTPLTLEFIAPSVTINTELSVDEVTRAIEDAFLAVTVADMNRNGEIAEDVNENGITDDQEVLQQAVMGFIKSNEPDMAGMRAMIEEANGVWANGKTLQQWNVARTLTLGDDEVGRLNLIQLCQSFYGGMALGFGLQHIPAMPCIAGVWKEEDGIHINLADPRFLFAYLFSGVQLDQDDEVQQRMGALFQLFPSMVFNELVSVLNVVVAELGGTQPFEFAEPPPAVTDQFEMVRGHIDAWLTETDMPIIPSSNVKDIVDDWDNQQFDYQIVSIRSPAHYSEGHVPNAINIPFRELTAEANLARLEPEKTLITYCYTGHTGQISATILNMLNFDAKNMKHGMMDWNLAQFQASGAKEWDGVADYVVETTPRTVEVEYQLPVVMTELDEAVAILQQRADTYLTSTIDTLGFTIPSSEVQAIVKDWDNQQDNYQIISVRSPEHYAVGHVPYAMNIPFRELTQLEQLQKLDPNKISIVYCYTGHTGQIATTLLNLAGYPARNIKFGMMDWNLETLQASGVAPWDQEADYPVVQ